MDVQIFMKSYFTDTETQREQMLLEKGDDRLAGHMVVTHLQLVKKEISQLP